MAIKGIYFNGRHITIPGAYSSVESTMTSTKSGLGPKVIALIGESDGGEPGALQIFSEPSIAKRVLKGGDLLKAAQKAWNPVSKTKDGVQLGGANYIICVRSNQATKSHTSVIYSQDYARSQTQVFTRLAPSTTGSVTITALTDEDPTVKYFPTTYTIHINQGGTLPIPDPDPAADPPVVPTPFTFSVNDSQGGTLLVNAPMTTDPITTSAFTFTFAEGVYNAGDRFQFETIPSAKAETPMGTIQSKDWGLDNNSLSLDISASEDVQGALNIVVTDTSINKYEMYRDVGVPFSIQYTGTNPAITTATLTILTSGTGRALRFVTMVGDGTTMAPDLDIELNPQTYRSLKAFINYLKGFTNYAVTEQNLNGSLLVTDLDFKNAADIKTMPVNVTAYRADIMSQFADQSQWVDVSHLEADMLIPTDMVGVYNFTGGGNGISPSSWEEYFAELGGKGITYIVPLINDRGIWAECYEHVRHMSDNMGMERRMMIGAGIGTTVSQAIADASVFDADRVQYVYPGMWDLDEYGETTLYPPYILAAQLAGRAAFLPDGEAATHDHFRMIDIEKKLNPDEITQLLNGGVVTFEYIIPDQIYASGSIRLVWDLTTYTDRNDPLYVERAVGITADSLNKELRAKLDELLVGKRTTTAILTTARNYVLSVLKQRVKDDVIVGYKDVVVYKEDGAVWVEYSVAPAEPTNYVLIKSHFYSENIFITGDESFSSGPATTGIL